MLTKNLKYLKKYYPDLYVELESFEKPVEILKMNQFKNFKYENTFMHSKYNPEVESDRWIEGIKIDIDMDSIFVIGLGLGYYLESLKKNYGHKKLIIVEPNLEVFKATMAARDISAYLKDEDMVFIVGKAPSTVKTLMEHFYVEGKVFKTYYTTMPIYLKTNETFIGEVFAELRKGFAQIQANIATERYFVDKWLRNVLNNLKYLKEDQSIKVISSNFVGKPAVIVSAGPSLNKQLELLKNNRDKFLVIAVGTAAAILDAHGIEPHVIMALDGNESEVEIFKVIKTSKPLLIYAHMLHDEVLKLYQGKRMWFIPSGDYRITEFCSRVDIPVIELFSGGSVAHNALAFCESAGCNPIILIGQDLAYTGDKLYANGSPHETDNVDRKHHVLLEDIYGEPIYTKHAFIDFRNWFEDFIEVRMKAHTVYNCTEGGLNIKGAENKPFKEVIESIEPISFDIDKCLNTLADKGDLAYDEKYEKKIKKLKLDLKKLYTLSKMRVKLLENMLTNNITEGAEYKAEFEALMKMTKQFERNEFYKIFIGNTGLFYHQAMNRAIHQDADKVQDVREKKRILLEGLLKTYAQIHNYVLVSLEAMDVKVDKTEVNGDA